jgi:hypothetical protein
MIGAMSELDPKLELARRLWDAYSEGPDAFADATPENLAFSPFAGEGRVVRGREENRGRLAGEAARGVHIQLHGYDFRRVGDNVLGHGSFRYHGPDGLSERQGWWLYRFDRDELLSIAAYGTREQAVAAAAAPAAAEAPDGG